MKEKLKKNDDNVSEPAEIVHYYSKRKSKTQQLANEENMSVKEMYFQTKSITSREEAMRFVASSSKLRTNDDEYEEVKGKKKLKIYDPRYKRLLTGDQTEDRCTDCQEKLAKHLSLRFFTSLKHCFVCFTPYEPFTAYYCQIRSRSHAFNNSVLAEEECWTEIRQVMRLLVSFFAQEYKCSVIFMETYFMQQKRSQNLSKNHFVIECVPIKEKLESDARIYFHVSRFNSNFTLHCSHKQKAIMECEEEWSINKKLIKLEKNSVTKMVIILITLSVTIILRSLSLPFQIPKGLPYFWVSFGANFNGFAHVIEDEDYFDKDFGKVSIYSFFSILQFIIFIQIGSHRRPS